MDEILGEAPFVTPAQRGPGGHGAGESEFGQSEFGESEFGESEFGESEFGEAGAGEFEAGGFEAGEAGFGGSELGEAGFGEAGFGEAGEFEAGEFEAGEFEAGEFELGGAGSGEAGGEFGSGGSGSGGESAFRAGGFGELGAGELGAEAAERAADRRIDEWESELGGAGGATPGARPAAGPCADRTWRDEPWRRGRPGRHRTPSGEVTMPQWERHAAVRVLELTDFDVDDHRLRPAHAKALGDLVDALAKGLRNGRFRAPVSVLVIGQASSSASTAHNLALSRHRAFNTLSRIQCLARRRGIEDRLRLRWVPMGESLSQSAGGDGVESTRFRSVRVQVVVPRAGCGCPPRPPGGAGTGIGTGVPGGAGSGGPVGPAGGPGRGPGGRRYAALCVTVLSVRRVASPGGTRALARVRVHDHRTRRVAHYVLRGVLLPAAVRGAGGSGGPFGVPGGVSGTVTGAVSDTVAAVLRLARRILTIALRAPQPRRRCRPTPAVAVARSPLTLLGGRALLVVPAAGPGRPVLYLRPRSRAVRLARRLLAVGAPRHDTPVLLAGRLRLVSVGRVRPTAGEAELGEWGELGEQAGESGSGEFGSGEFGGGELGAGEFEAGEFGSGEFEGRELGAGEFESGEFASGEFEAGEFESGEFEGGEFESGEFESGGEYGSGEFESGEFEDELGEDERGEPAGEQPLARW